jgi:hypothetical protein
MNGNGIDYEKVRDGELHVIGIGGLALARGLTLEGLAISYALRNVGAADTLLQMGRWFGYRPGYENLCRIHAAQGLIDDFEYVSESVEELRTDFQRMVQLGKTPYDFGLKVRQSPTGIQITAANKMQTATPILLAEDFSTRHIQAHSLYDDKSINTSNLNCILKFIKTLKDRFPENFYNDTKKHALVWHKIPVNLILDLIKELKFPQAEFSMIASGENGLLTDYIGDRVESELKYWDIGIPYITKQNSINLPIENKEKIYCRSRSGAFTVAPGVIKVNRKNAVAFGVEELTLGQNETEFNKRKLEIETKYKLELVETDDGVDKAVSQTWLHSMARSRPLVLLHFLQIKPATDEIINLPIDEPVGSIGILLPGTQIKCKPRKYQASLKLIELLKRQREEAESDEVLVDE